MPEAYVPLSTSPWVLRYHRSLLAQISQKYVMLIHGHFWIYTAKYKVQSSNSGPLCYPYLCYPCVTPVSHLCYPYAFHPCVTHVLPLYQVCDSCVTLCLSCVTPVCLCVTPVLPLCHPCVTLVSPLCYPAYEVLS